MNYKPIGIAIRDAHEGPQLTRYMGCNGDYVRGIVTKTADNTIVITDEKTGEVAMTYKEDQREHFKSINDALKVICDRADCEVFSKYIDGQKDAS